MVPEMEKPRVTEIKVRMDCNGCVQKIKKALQGINGIHDIYVDFPEQKLTITGWAQPEKLVKAIRKTRKSAVICVHTEQSNPPEGEGAPEEDVPPPETPPGPTNPPQMEAAPPAEAPDEPPPPQLENPPPATRQPHQPTRPNDVDGVHVVYHHPPDDRYGGWWKAYHGGPGFRDERHQPTPPVYVQSYNTYRPSPHPTDYAHLRPPPPRYSYDTRPDHYSGPEFRDEPPQPQQPPQPVYATHSYNTYKPSPYVTGYQSPPRCSTYTRPDNSNGLGLRGEGEQSHPSQPPQPVYATHGHNIYRPPPNLTYTRPDSSSGPGLRGEGEQSQPSQPPQPVYATQGHNIYRPPPNSTYTRPDNCSGPGLRGEGEQSLPSQPPQPIYATHGHNIYRPPPSYTTYTRPDNSSGPRLRGEGEQSQPSQPPQPDYATHGHNIYRPSPYVTEYAYPESPPRYSSYSMPDNYNRDYYSGSHGNGNVTSMFSEENPNACRIV